MEDSPLALKETFERKTPTLRRGVARDDLGPFADHALTPTALPTLGSVFPIGSPSGGYTLNQLWNMTRGIKVLGVFFPSVHTSHSENDPASLTQSIYIF